MAPSLLLLRLSVNRHEKSQNVDKSHGIRLLTWMALSDRLGCEQKGCVVFHFVAVVDVIAVGVAVHCGFGHFFTTFFFELFEDFSSGKYKLLITFLSLYDAFRLCTTM